MLVIVVISNFRKALIGQIGINYFPGVVFKFTLKDLFPYEANEMLGKYVSAVYENHYHAQGGGLEVWVKCVVHKPSKPQQQVCH